MRQKLIELKEEIDEGDFNVPLSEMDRSSWQKISKDIVKLNSTIGQVDIIDMYRLLYPTTVEYTFFSNLHGTFTNCELGHILGHKIYLNKFKRREIRQCLFSDHKRNKLEINNRMIIGKSPNAWGLKTLLNNKLVKEEISRKIVKNIELNEFENKTINKLLG